MNKNVERYHPNIQTGLTEEQVKKRMEQNLVNYDTSVPTKSIKYILYENFFTLFNFLNLFLGIAVFLVGSYRNMLFLLLVMINTAISTIQEIHSKKVVDKLSVLAQSKAKVIRNGKKQEIAIHEIVLDDILEFHTGNQVVTDSMVQSGEVLVNESYITGEPNSITKRKGDMILSGSFIISGICLVKVEHIAEDNYTSKISSDAKYIKKMKSEIMTSLQKIIKFATFAIVPVGAALFLSQFYLQGISLQESVVQTVAAVIGMIPEGLVLLTSTVLAVSVIRLSKAKVLVQDLYCIETLARVNTLCLDKTGTLTEGNLEVVKYIPFDDNSIEYLEQVLANLGKFSEDENSTIQAIRAYNSKITEEFIPDYKVAFSSETKWSGIHFKDKGSYMIGAPNFVLRDNWDTYQDWFQEYAKDYRVLVVAHSYHNFKDKNLPSDIKPIGVVLLLDKIRKDASKTLKYFDKQGVDIKIISGDNPITVSKIAKRVGVKNFDKYIDMSTIDDEEIDDLVLNYSVFGRVSPIQKKNLVKALQKHNKAVAMTGDGVNDVLALKEADCSIAMANGSDASKNIAQLVLLNSDFASMPKVVSEGRRTINNIQRSASLFLVKTIYSSLLALMVLFLQDEYPFIPIQLSLISLVAIGIPSFLLALEPNKERVRGNFLKNVITRALPTGLLVVASIFIILLLNRFGIIIDEKVSSLCVLLTGIWSLALLFTFVKSRKSEANKFPFSIYRLVLSLAMGGLFVLGFTYFAPFFHIIL